MNVKFKTVLQAELLNGLRSAIIGSSVDVNCDTGKGAYTLDVALHTDEFIFGNIAVCERAVPDEVLRRFGIEQVECNKIEDIDRCVIWAKLLQDRYMVSHPAQMVA